MSMANEEDKEKGMLKRDLHVHFAKSETLDWLYKLVKMFSTVNEFNTVWLHRLLIRM